MAYLLKKKKKGYRFEGKQHKKSKDCRRPYLPQNQNQNLHVGSLELCPPPLPPPHLYHLQSRSHQRNLTPLSQNQTC